MRQRRRRIYVDPEVIIVPIVFGMPTVAFMLRMLLKHKEKMASLRAPQDQSAIDARQAGSALARIPVSARPSVAATIVVMSLAATP